jgi:hypothetical protein
MENNIKVKINYEESFKHNFKRDVNGAVRYYLQLHTGNCSKEGYNYGIGFLLHPQALNPFLKTMETLNEIENVIVLNMPCTFYQNDDNVKFNIPTYLILKLPLHNMKIDDLNIMSEGNKIKIENNEDDILSMDRIKSTEEIANYAELVLDNIKGYNMDTLNDMILKYVNSYFDESKIISFKNMNEALNCIISSISSKMVYKKLSNSLKNIEFRYTKYGDSSHIITNAKEIKFNGKIISLNEDKKYWIYTNPIKFPDFKYVFLTYDIMEIKQLINRVTEVIKNYIIKNTNKNSKRIIIMFEREIIFNDNGSMMWYMGIVEE